MGWILAKLVALMLLNVASGAIGILSMLYGWGVSPLSWSVIIWSLVAQFGLLIVAKAVTHNG